MKNKLSQQYYRPFTTQRKALRRKWMDLETTPDWEQYLHKAEIRHSLRESSFYWMLNIHHKINIRSYHKYNRAHVPYWAYDPEDLQTIHQPNFNK